MGEEVSDQTREKNVDTSFEYADENDHIFVFFGFFYSLLLFQECLLLFYRFLFLLVISHRSVRPHVTFSIIGTREKRIIEMKLSMDMPRMIIFYLL